MTYKVELRKDASGTAWQLIFQGRVVANIDDSVVQTINLIKDGKI